MNPKSSEREELPARDRRWVEALRAHAPSGPPPILDAAVLAAARTAVGANAAAPPTGSIGRGGTPRWLSAVAGVMVVLSAGVLVQQVALETAPMAEPEFSARESVAAPSPRSAAEERAGAALRTTREVDGLPARETVESEAPVEANVADAALVPAPKPEAAPITAQAKAERAMRTQAMADAPTAPPPPSESPTLGQIASAPASAIPPAPSAPARPAADLAPSVARPLTESAPVPEAFSTPAAEPAAAAKSALAERREQADAGLAAAASAEQEAGLPEPDVLAEVRRLLAAGDRDAARDLLQAWRERHPAVELPPVLDALVAEDD